jgi:NADH-quinone oxidoreductase subunit L
MFLALGVGAYWVAIFHLFTHAFFKALLFLCSGSVIHAMGGEQDMRRMGGLKDKIPVTHWTMWVGSVAIAGIPGLAGFFSKDEILWQAFRSPKGSAALYVVGLVTAALTAFYMWRLMDMTFYGKSRVEPETAKHIHESPWNMTVPLTVLAAGSVFVGWLGTPKLWTMFGDAFRVFPTWLAPMFQLAELGDVGNTEATEWSLMLLSVAVAAGGIAVAYVFYVKKPWIPEKLYERFRGLHKVLYNKWYVDEIYDFLFVNGLCKGGGRAMGAFDREVVDGGVNGAGWLTRAFATISMWWDRWIVDGAVRFTGFFVRMLAYPATLIETGRVQAYALFVVAGVLAFLGYYVVR